MQKYQIDAIISEEVQNIPHYIYDDKNLTLFNIKNPKNIEYINRKNFEFEVIQEQIKSERKEKTSLKVKIAWALCHNTRKTAKGMVAQHPEYMELFKKIDKVREYQKRLAANKIEEGETEPYLTKDDRIKLKIFYKTLWRQAGTDEFKNAMLVAKEAIAQYKQEGPEAIEDNTIKNIIKEFYEK